MARKKVSINPKPGSEKPASVDEWVASRNAAGEIPEETESEPVKMKRLTLDIPEPLHRAIKRQAVDQGVTMAELLRDLLVERYGGAE